MSGEPMPLLEARSVTIRYGGVVANDAVTVQVGPGEAVGLIGPNGAGKTSFVDAITGYTPYTGSVVLDGRKLDRLPAHQRARAGLRRTWQSVELFRDLTVGENLRVASDQITPRTAFLELIGRSNADGRVEDALEALGIAELSDRDPEELSLGQQKLAGVARALVADPRVLCLDEPAAGLDSTEARELCRRLAPLTNERRGLLLIDHDLNLVFDLCDRVYVLVFGSVLATGPAEEIRTDPRVVEAYLGTAVSSHGDRRG